jgi:hypothetical protein
MLVKLLSKTPDANSNDTSSKLLSNGVSTLPKKRGSQPLVQLPKTQREPGNGTTTDPDLRWEHLNSTPILAMSLWIARCLLN